MIYVLFYIDNVTWFYWHNDTTYIPQCGMIYVVFYIDNVAWFIDTMTQLTFHNMTWFIDTMTQLTFHNMTWFIAPRHNLHSTIWHNLHSTMWHDNACRTGKTCDDIFVSSTFRIKHHIGPGHQWEQLQQHCQPRLLLIQEVGRIERIFTKSQHIIHPVMTRNN